MALVTALVLSGCGDYLSNRDRISQHTGDASEANTAIQAIRAWPPNVYDTDINL
ncbi:hypothetical protein H9Q16_19925 [Sulfitobacter sp. TSTF-M16]|uniref:Uncharacterized protein n=1 Tax=Sulfitobacter aestuariivivens TaxID=2766981 RepID=A0A927D9H4_9RHOB|nr:hypothetical protein [Sulfitobacter aestuariivivens]